jgi:hypothetical protein
MKKRLALAVLAAAALGSGCTLHPSSPGFLPDGSSIWIFDQPTEDRGTVRTWMYWCHGTEEAPQPCGTERNWQWGELGTVAP